MTLVSVPKRTWRVRVVEQHFCSRDIGPWCVQLSHYATTMHVARHTTRASAEKHAKRLRAALMGEA